MARVGAVSVCVCVYIYIIVYIYIYIYIHVRIIKPRYAFTLSFGIHKSALCYIAKIFFFMNTNYNSHLYIYIYIYSKSRWVPVVYEHFTLVL